MCQTVVVLSLLGLGWTNHQLTIATRQAPPHKVGEEDLCLSKQLITQILVRSSHTAGNPQAGGKFYLVKVESKEQQNTPPYHTM